MTRLVSILAICVLVGLTITSGLIHGRMSDRWGGTTQATQPAVEKLRQLPSDFGNWRGQPPETMSKNVEDMLECKAYIVRNYINQDTGDTVRMALILGPAGPTSVHTPEICYSSRSYQIVEQRKRVKWGDSEDEFWTLTFQSLDVNAALMRVYYAWSTGSHWKAVDNPRFSLAGSPYLYKIQLACWLPAGEDFRRRDPCREFLRAFLPAARHYLVECSSD